MTSLLHPPPLRSDRPRAIQRSRSSNGLICASVQKHLLHSRVLARAYRGVFFQTDVDSLCVRSSLGQTFCPEIVFVAHTAECMSPLVPTPPRTFLPSMSDNPPGRRMGLPDCRCPDVDRQVVCAKRVLHRKLPVWGCEPNSIFGRLPASGGRSTGVRERRDGTAVRA